MKMKIKLVPFLLAAILFFALTGCSDPMKGHENTAPDEKNEESAAGEGAEEHKLQPDEEEPAKDPVKEIDISLNPNEIGEIMILMYHGIGEDESTWQRTPDNLRRDLEYMYQNGYRMISLNDYAKGIIKTKAGYTPIILTFDDGRQNNFNIIRNADGEIEIDPNCAVGILEEFRKKYPDFDVTASFFLTSNIFGQEEYKEYKLKYLVENGYDIGNHTKSHNEMAKQDGKVIQTELGFINNTILSYLPDYTVETVALPTGSNPRPEYEKYVLEGEHDGIKYKNIAVLDVGWRPAYSPFDTMNNFLSLYRITASEINVGGCGIYDYFKQFEDNKREKFISDGNPDVVTIPKRHEKYINMDMVGDRLLNIYE